MFDAKLACDFCCNRNFTTVSKELFIIFFPDENWPNLFDRASQVTLKSLLCLCLSNIIVVLEPGPRMVRLLPMVRFSV